MGRVIAIGPGGRAQAPSRFDPYIQLIAYVREAGLLDQPRLMPIEPGEILSQSQADLMRRALYSSCRYFCSCEHKLCTRQHPNWPWGEGCPRGGQRISCRADVVLWRDPANGKQRYRVQFTLFDKRESTLEVIRKHGDDPNRWPYFSRRKQLKG